MLVNTRIIGHWKLIDTERNSHAYRRTNVSKLISTRSLCRRECFSREGSVINSDDEVGVEFVALDAAR